MELTLSQAFFDFKDKISIIFIYVYINNLNFTFFPTKVIIQKINLWREK